MVIKYSDSPLSSDAVNVVTSCVEIFRGFRR